MTALLLEQRLRTRGFILTLPHLFYGGVLNYGRVHICLYVTAQERKCLSGVP
jgi:hypothetical protein